MRPGPIPPGPRGWLSRLRGLASQIWTGTAVALTLFYHLHPSRRFKLRKAKSARNKILAKALNSKKRTLRKAGKL